MNDPGRLVPDDIKHMADFLGICESELITAFLVKIKFVINGRHGLYYAPAKRKGKNFVAEPGTVAPDYYVEERGSCIFLDDSGRCSVHSVKPFECRAYMGCRNTFLDRPYKEKTVEEFFANKWKARVISGK